MNEATEPLLIPPNTYNVESDSTAAESNIDIIEVRRRTVRRVQSSESSSSSRCPRYSCCSFLSRWAEGNNTAEGSAWINASRGLVTCHNLFINSGLLYLSKQAAIDKCGLDYKNNDNGGGCLIFGSDPESIVDNVMANASLISAFCMPIIGACLDYTPYRKSLGIACCSLMMVLLALQTWLNEQTWFYMSIAQVLIVFLNFVLLVPVTSYLPEIASEVGEETTAKFSSVYQIFYFVSIMFFIMVVNGFFYYGLGDVETAQVSTVVSMILSTTLFYYAWSKLPFVGAKRTLEEEGREGKSLILVGFIELWETTKLLYNNFTGLLLFFVTIMFTGAVTETNMYIGQTILISQYKFKSFDCSLCVLTEYIFAISGSHLVKYLSLKTNPRTAYFVSLWMFIITILGSSAYILLDIKSMSILYIIFGLNGLCQGMILCVETIIFSILVPEGRESVMSGFFTYCSFIIAFTPTYISSTLISKGYAYGYGYLQLAGFLIVAFFVFSFTPSWEVLIRSRGATSITTTTSESRQSLGAP